MAILARPRFVPHLVPSASPMVDLSVPSPLDGAHTDDARARLTTLYAQHGPRIHRFLRDLLGDPTLAADGTQETFVRAYKKLASFDESSGIAPWLFGIARNVSLELRRARLRANRHLATTSLESADEQTGNLGGVRSPESEVLGREALHIVSAALAKLPEERRAMLLLRLDHGLSYEDIAVTMECSLAKVKIEIFRAREALRGVMLAYENGRNAR